MSADEQGIQAELAALHGQLDRIEQALQEVLARLPKPFNAQEVVEAMLANMQRQESQPSRAQERVGLEWDTKYAPKRQGADRPTGSA